MSEPAPSPLPDQDLLQRYYPEGAPIIIQVGFKYGYGPALIELNRKVYLDENPLFSSAIREAIQAIVLSSCENKYCMVMHLRGLIAEGFSMAEIKGLVETQRLPDRVTAHLDWEVTLRRLATLCLEPKLAPQLYASLRELHKTKVVDAIGGVVAFSLQHKILLDLYAGEIQIEQEPILFRTIDCAEELISYIAKRGEQSVPLYSLCCICKDIKVKSGWIAVETALAQIPSDAVFSHGFCERCAERQLALL